MGPKSRRVPQELRQRTERSCDRCKSRKQKCHIAPGEDKCRHCTKYNYDCVITKPRKQRLYGSVDSHSTRISVLESLVKGLVPEADISSLETMQDMATSLGIPLPDTISTSGAGGDSDQVTSSTSAKENEHLVHDLQGQGQYIGRASSYFFQMKLRALVGRSHTGAMGHMLLFGPNPANTKGATDGALATIGDRIEDVSSMASAASPSTCSIVSTGALPTQADRATVLQLVRTFFDRINTDFPVLHEATFLERLDSWYTSPSTVDQVWLCSFLCVLLLARRFSDLPISEEQEERSWCKIQSLLSKVMFTSSLMSIQALMLAALHLHNTNSRDTCWTLTGAAVRIGFAIGLHRDDIETNDTPLAREMRKRVWWTLYAFEQLQVSSHDRPSAIDTEKHLAGQPREAILDMGTHNLPEYMTWSNRLVVLLGAACRALPDASKEGHCGPLSPAAGLLRDLSRWKTAIPQHLSVDRIDAMPPSFQRPLILLHVQYHYIVSLISRYALLSRFTALSKDKNNTNTQHNETLVSMATVCVESGRQSCQLLLKLDSIGLFNAVSWLDVYYLYSSALVLVLGIICDLSQNNHDSAAEQRRLLGQGSRLAAKHLLNPRVPGTMHRWLTVVGELNSMAIDFTSRCGEAHIVSPVESDLEPWMSTSDSSAMQLLVASNSGDSSRRAHSGRNIAEIDGTNGSDFMPETMPSFLPTADYSTAQAGLTTFGNLRMPDFGYDFFNSPGDPTDPRFSHEMHWEGISDMILGMETRSWNV